MHLNYISLVSDVYQSNYEKMPTRHYMVVCLHSPYSYVNKKLKLC